nr:MAG TPA: Protein of unknown function (DUF2634) [Caudoviricetes sp.]
MKEAYKFDFEKGEFVFKNKDAVVLTGYDALKQWIEKCIRTQLNRYPMYKGTGYGANIKDLVIGKSYRFDFAESELRREVETALLKHDDIYKLENFRAVKNGDVLNIEFTLTTKYGTVTEVYAA